MEMGKFFKKNSIATEMYREMLLLNKCHLKSKVAIGIPNIIANQRHSVWNLREVS